MSRVDGRGRCESCRAVFPYEIVHNGFNDSMFAYCELCGTTAIVNVLEAERRLGELPRVLAPIPSIVETAIQPCSCGGRFRGDAPARCPSCYAALSADRAAAWLEAGRAGWQWQRSWAGLYALILGGRVVFDPWLVG